MRERGVIEVPPHETDGDPPAAPRPRAGGRASGPRWSSEDPIGQALRRLHDAVAAEPLPEEFLDLIAEIDLKVGRDRSE